MATDDALKNYIIVELIIKSLNEKSTEDLVFIYLFIEDQLKITQNDSSFVTIQLNSIHKNRNSYPYSDSFSPTLEADPNISRLIVTATDRICLYAGKLVYRI